MSRDTRPYKNTWLHDRRRQSSLNFSVEEYADRLSYNIYILYVYRFQSRHYSVMNRMSDTHSPELKPNVSSSSIVAAWHGWEQDIGS